MDASTNFTEADHGFDRPIPGRWPVGQTVAFTCACSSILWSMIIGAVWWLL